jgi:predicted ester cyclase
MRRLVECFGGADPSGVVSDHYLDHQGKATSGLAGFAAMTAQLRSAFPDLQVEIEDLIADGDRVAARLRWRGTFQGTFWGKQPTGKPIEAESIELVRFQGGQAVEHWGLSQGWP